MSIEDWLQWPTKSTDPAANAAIAVLLAVVAIILVVVGGVFLLPVVAIIAVAKGVHWYVNRPTPTDQIYAQTQQRSIAANFPTAEQFVDAYIDRLLDAIGDEPPAYSIYLTIFHIAGTLYRAENLSNLLPPIAATNAIEEGRYRDQLIAHQRKTADAPRTLELFNATLGKCVLDFLAALPPMAKTTPAQFGECDRVEAFATFPLVDILSEPSQAVEAVIYPFFTQAADEIGLFESLRKTLTKNYPRDSTTSANLIPPEKFKGTAQESVATYLADTPLEALFYAPIPFAFTDAQRFEHMHIVGGSGHGKTQLLQRLILADLTREQPPALIIVDSQGEMLSKIERLQLFTGKLADKLIIIDPEDVAHAPALNMFDTSNARLAGYSQAHKEQIEAGVVELYNYIFAAIAAEMTSRQSTAFTFVTRLMLSMPNSTIHTLRELMEDPAQTFEQSAFAAQIEALDATSQAYFRNQFYTRRYSDLRQQIARRLYSVVSVPSFDRMFSAPVNKLDMFDAIQNGKVVLINTSKALLKSDASALFGRYMIALTIKAAFERVAATERKPAYLFVDEAAEYFDDNIETLLSQARKFNLGVVVAHQHLDQLSTGLRSSVAANTSIKLAGGVSDKDARALAADMRTDADFITSMAKHPCATEFACYVRNYTGNAVRLEIPFGALEQAPTMSAAEHAALIDRNRRRYAVDRAPPRPDANGPEPSQPTVSAAPKSAEAPETADAPKPSAAPATPAVAADDWRS